MARPKKVRPEEIEFDLFEETGEAFDVDEEVPKLPEGD